MDTPVPGAGSHRLVDSKPNKLGYAVRFFNPFYWILDLIAVGLPVPGTGEPLVVYRTALLDSRTFAPRNWPPAVWHHYLSWPKCVV